MWAAVRDGGVLIVEDADFDGWCCDPADEGLDLLRDAYRRVLARRGGDDTAGRRLYSRFLAAGIPAPRVRLVQPVYEGEARTLAWSTLEATADAIVAEGVATADELAAALASLRRLAADQSALICGPRVFQVWSRRLASDSAAAS